MPETLDLVIHRGVCLTPSGRLETDVGVRGGKIVAIGDLEIGRAHV